MSLLQDILISQMAASEGMPDGMVLFKPDEENQILMNENAASIAVQTFFRMCGIEVQIANCTNAEHISPSGNVPVLLSGSLTISEPLPIFNFLKQKGFSLSGDLNDNETQELKAYTELINNILIPAELFIMWLHKDTLKQVTQKRYGHPYPWPLNHILPFCKQRSVSAHLSAIGWGKNQKSLSIMDEEVQTCCAALSQKLGDKRFFFGDKPTELDALVFGHLYTIITTTLPDNRLAKTIQQFDNLVSFCQNIDSIYFKRNKDLSPELE